MLPDPLHPAIVHLPIALAVIVPLAAIVTLLAIARGFVPARVWLGVVLLQALLLGSGWLASETGEDEEERVERVVAERHIEEHEEAAETFLLLAGIGLVVIGTGLVPGAAGLYARIAGTVAALGVLAAGVRVGHLGGELVYVHGAGSAYIESAKNVESANSAEPGSASPTSE